VSIWSRHVVTWFAAAFATCFVLSTTRAQQGSVTICLNDGTKIVAQHFEHKEGKFLFYVPGSSTALEYPDTSVKGINVADCGVASAPGPSSQHFGIHGSNTIGERLMPMLIDAYAQKRLGTRTVNKPGQPEEQEITIRAGGQTRAVVDFQAHGSDTSAKSLLDGSAIIGMSSRRANDDEARAVSERFGVNLRGPGNEHVLALDGLAVIVNSSNSVATLSLDQIAQIFSGRITNWSQVGGRDEPVRVLRRDDKSGTYDTFKSLVLKPAGMTISPTAEKYESSENLSDDVAKDQNAIGFIGLPYIGKNRALKLSSSCGLSYAPSRFSIKSEQYPLARRLYLYTIGTPSEPTAREILEFALSDNAQATIKEAEFVDQAVEFEDKEEQRAWAQAINSDPNLGLDAEKEVPQRLTRDFIGAMEDVGRATVVFRFEQGKSELDTRARQDVQRLARYLANQSTSVIYLAGFADSKGSWAQNQRLAFQRAAAVATELAHEGARIPRKNVLTFSYMAPVACNDSDNGMAKNRRVEVWVAR
jgi:phosphate transport system substrate-binding protein